MRYLSNVVTLSYDRNKCVGCGRCAEVCPHGVFVIKTKRAEITDKDLCMECGACAMNCAYGAIKVDAGTGCAAAVINSLVKGGPPSCDCSTDTGCC